MNREEQLDFYNRTFFNERVIVRSNENEPLWIGVIQGFDYIGKNDTKPSPYIKNEKDGKEYLVFSHIRLYSDELMAALEKLTPREQWVVMTEGKIL